MGRSCRSEGVSSGVSRSAERRARAARRRSGRVRSLYFVAAVDELPAAVARGLPGRRRNRLRNGQEGPVPSAIVRCCPEGPFWERTGRTSGEPSRSGCPTGAGRPLRERPFLSPETVQQEPRGSRSLKTKQHVRSDEGLVVWRAAVLFGSRPGSTTDRSSSYASARDLDGEPRLVTSAPVYGADPG